MTKERAKASSPGKMAEFMMECGKTESNMEEENSSQRKELKE